MNEQEVVRDAHLHMRNRRALADWLHRLADHVDRRRAFPDPRNHDLMDRGVENDWRRGVVNLEQETER